MLAEVVTFGVILCHWTGESWEGFPHGIVIDVCFIRQIILAGFSLEQKLPGTGHLCDFAKQVTSLDLNARVLLLWNW